MVAKAAELRALLERHGVRPSRRRGQNFLLDRNLLRAIASDAGLQQGDRVLEVGSGPGLLTAHLLDAGAEVLAVEIDPALIEVAKELIGRRGGWRVIAADILAGKHALAPEVEVELATLGSFSLVANLPYAVATPCLLLLARREPPPRRMVALVQEEVAERFAARAGCSAYGAVSVQLQARYRIRILRRIPPQVFWPRPRVNSALVRFDLRDNPAKGELLDRLDSILAAGFRERRKVFLGRMTGLAPRAFWASRLSALGLEHSVRAEHIDVEQFLALARACEEKAKDCWTD